MLASEIRSKYFAELSGRYLRLQRIATWGVLLFSSADVVSLLSQLPNSLRWMRLALTGLTAATSTYLALSQNERNAIDCSTLYGRWSRLQARYEEIWENVYAEDAALKLKALEEEAISASEAATDLKNDSRAMLRWQEHTEREIQARFAA